MGDLGVMVVEGMCMRTEAGRVAARMAAAAVEMRIMRVELAKRVFAGKISEGKYTVNACLNLRNFCSKGEWDNEVLQGGCAEVGCLSIRLCRNLMVASFASSGTLIVGGLDQSES